MKSGSFCQRLLDNPRVIPRLVGAACVQRHVENGEPNALFKATYTIAVLGSRILRRFPSRRAAAMRVVSWPLLLCADLGVDAEGLHRAAVPATEPTIPAQEAATGHEQEHAR